MTSNRTSALTDEGRPTLDHVVASALDKAKALRAHLAIEQRALVGTDAEALQSVFAVKAELAGALEKLETQRRALCAAQLGSSRPDASLFREALTPPARLNWDDYCDELQACQEANAINGRVTWARQRHVRQALDILRGQPAHEPGLYNARGATDSQGQNQRLGSA